MNAKIDISGVVLKSDRLVIRAWQASDLQDFYNYASVPGVGEMAGWKAHEDIAESKRILDKFIGDKSTLALEYQGKVIGSLGIDRYDEQQFPEFADLKARELGFVLAKEYWGQGLMPEAVNCVIDYLFTQVKLDLLLCGYFLPNKQSKRVQEKCHFQHYCDVDVKTSMGTSERTAINILTRETWAKLHSSTSAVTPKV